ncbi:MAG: antitoxin [Hyphomicrobiales bacterium]|nr:antitoxin [Hyphomicrobiales bacterium]
MQRIHVRKVGGSVMLAGSPAILELLASPGAAGGTHVDAGKLIVEPSPKRRCSIAELVAECEASPPQAEHHEWLNGKPLGSELL